MSYELRPLTLAEILDAAFRLVQTQWKTLIGLSLIMQIPVVLLASAVPWMFDPLAQPFANADEVTTEILLEMAAGIGGLGLLYLFLYPFVAAAVTASVGNFYLGRRFELADAARAGLRTLFRLVACLVVWGIAYLGAMLLISSATTGGGFLLAGLLAGLGHGYCFPVLISQADGFMVARRSAFTSEAVSGVKGQ